MNLSLTIISCYDLSIANTEYFNTPLNHTIEIRTEFFGIVTGYYHVGTDKYEIEEGKCEGNNLTFKADDVYFDLTFEAPLNKGNSPLEGHITYKGKKSEIAFAN